MLAWHLFFAKFHNFILGVLLGGIRPALSIAGCAVLLAGQASAWERSAPPYPAGKFPPNCNIELLKPEKGSGADKAAWQRRYQLRDQQQELRLELRMNYGETDFGLYATLRDAKQVQVPPFKISDHPSYLGKLYQGYLNKDGRKDFIINVLDGDVNLSGYRQASYFLLSQGKTAYRVYRVGSYALEAEDFYDFTQDNKCEYLHLSFVADRQHQFWVYNVLQFNASGVQMRNKLSRYFPKWIPFSASSRNVSQTQRTALWKGYMRKNPISRQIYP